MSTYTVGKDIQALVADIGSYSTKIGYAGDDHPTAIYNSTTAIERNTSNNNNNGSNFINGPKRDFTTRPLVANSENSDGNYELVNPINSTTGWAFSPPSQTYTSFNNNNNENTKDKLGDVWESHELINRYLDHAFTNNLGLGSNSNSQDSVSNHPLLLLDKSHTPPAIRQRLCEVLFETHDFPAVFFLRDAIAACYAVGKTTATVVDVGYSSTTVTPVYEGFVESRGILRNNACGGKSVEEQVLKMMDGIVKQQGGINRKQRLRRECVKKIENMNEAATSNPAATADTNKRDASGHFKKAPSLQPPPLSAIPDYLMPIYQVRRTPTYTPRSGPFHNWSRMTLARELKEGGLGVAVGPLGYVTTATARANAAAAAASGEGEDTNPSSQINPLTANNMFLTSSKLPYKLPDGTNVEIPTSSRCDVVELFFGNDEYNTNYREQVFDDTVTQLEEYEGEIEKLLSKKKKDDDEDDEESNKDKMMGITSSSAGEAGDPYSNTSYRGEKTQRHGGKKTKTYYPPSTISKKLYTACLPYIRTAPPNDDALEGEDGAAAPTPVTSINDNYFHYLTSAPPAQMVCDAAFRCDRDQQAALLGNVVVCGGGSCITGAAGVGSALGGGAAGTLGTAGSMGGGAVASALGDEHAFPDRLREEIESIVHRHTPGWRVKVTSPNINERTICSWLGGSILGSLGTFQDMWISKRDYEEFGSAIVNRKCP